MDAKTKSTIDTFVAKFNAGLPCRIQFPRRAQTPSSPGPSEHTGWVVEMRYTHSPAKKRNMNQFNFVIAFPDPLEVVDPFHIQRIPADQRKWKLFGLSSFVHTCYFNWDVSGWVSEGKTYTRPPHPSSNMEMIPSTGENLCSPMRLDKLIPTIMRMQDPQQWVHLLEKIPIPLPNPNCPKEWKEAIANTQPNSPGGRRNLRRITAPLQSEATLAPSTAHPHPSQEYSSGVIQAPHPIRAKVYEDIVSFKRSAPVDEPNTLAEPEERSHKRIEIAVSD